MKNSKFKLSLNYSQARKFFETILFTVVNGGSYQPSTMVLAQ